MTRLAQKFLTDLEVGPDNGLFSTDFMRKYALTYSQVLIEFSNVERLGYVILKNASSMSGKDFIATITPPGSSILGENNLRLDYAKAASDVFAQHDVKSKKQHGVIKHGREIVIGIIITVAGGLILALVSKIFHLI